jgi:hypothetical protein
MEHIFILLIIVIINYIDNLLRARRWRKFGEWEREGIQDFDWSWSLYKKTIYDDMKEKFIYTQMLKK